MSANATRSNTAVEAPDTNIGRIDHIHMLSDGLKFPPLVDHGFTQLLDSTCSAQERLC
eukprot:CAMPEP_0184392922 /NCGR_PEP_ID=MMETSP0007-20130409/31262_1 /TAXON_ID=97485 /ORGANISM="Prymnesium parvum, Strain Texoma1" /LENGTH=57 /DNA_ID=CAMNT_0026743677 /DNA_START=92 /DNA_END=265 /DNA_ORIENTATION=-